MYMQFLVLLCFLAGGCRNEELGGFYSLTVTMKTDPQNKLYVFYRGTDDSIRIDSALYRNGKFELKGKITYPQRALICLDRSTPTFFEDAVRFSDYAMFVFLEKGKIQVQADKTLRNSRLSGTSSNEDLQIYTDSIRFYRDWLDGYRERFRVAYLNRDEKAFDRLNKEKRNMECRLKNTEEKFFRTHLKSLVALDWLSRTYNIAREKSTVVSMFNTLDDQVVNSIPGMKYKALLNKIASVETGCLAPDFIAKNIEGKEVSLSSFQGQYVLLDFWASWCAPCRRENVNVLKVYEHFKDRGFTVLGYSLDRNREAWVCAVKKDNMPWEQLSGLDAGIVDVPKLYGVTAIPSNFLIDPQGKIVGVDLRGEKLGKMLEKII